MNFDTFSSSQEPQLRLSQSGWRRRSILDCRGEHWTLSNKGDKISQRTRSSEKILVEVDGEEKLKQKRKWCHYLIISVRQWSVITNLQYMPSRLPLLILTLDMKNAFNDAWHSATTVLKRHATGSQTNWCWSTENVYKALPWDLFCNL